MTKLVFISDTHNKHKKLTIPECDILFHSGDWTSRGHHHEVRDFAKWLDKQPAKHIVLTPGNHEVEFSKDIPNNRAWVLDHCPRATLLVHEAAEVEGIKIFGSPYTPLFGNGWAFNAGRTITEAAYAFKPFIGDKWADIPTDTEILITHGPGLGTLDIAMNYQAGRMENVGCAELTKRIQYLHKLKIHAFGHLHFEGGASVIIENTRFINAAMCNDQYELNRLAMKVEFKK